MLNADQIKLVQTAVRAAGIRKPNNDGRYRLLLGQYKQSNGSAVMSCKQLTNSQLDDLLAICEAQGWRMPGKEDDFYRKKIIATADFASFAQQEGIKHLAGDLGWNEWQVGGLLEKMTNGTVFAVQFLTPMEAYKIIEALKAMLERKTGRHYENLSQIKEEKSARNGETMSAPNGETMEAVRDGSNQIT